MPIYSYDAVNSDGEVISGELSAISDSEAIKHLEASGLVIQSVRVAPIIEMDESRSGPRPAFLRQIDAALARRETLIPALEALADEMASSGAAADIRELVNALRRGASTEVFIQDEALSVWLPLLVHDFSSPSASIQYQHLIGEATREGEIRSHRRRQLAYPLIVSGIAMLVVMILYVTVIPAYQAMFRDFGLRLPYATWMLLSMSDQVTEHPIRLIASFLVLACAVYVLAKLWLRYALTTRFLGRLTAGSSANLAALARFTRTLAELLNIDAPLPDALRIAGRSCQHLHFRRMAERLAHEVASPLKTFRDSSVAHNFPSSLLYALEMGTERRPNIPLLRQLSSVYSDRVRRRTDWSAAFLGPTAVVVLGGVVACIMVALLAPLVGLITGAAHF